MNTLSLEAVDFQYKSQLVQELNDLNKSVFDALQAQIEEKSIDHSHMTPQKGRSISILCRDIIKNLNYSDKLKEIIFNNLNIRITTFMWGFFEQLNAAVFFVPESGLKKNDIRGFDLLLSGNRQSGLGSTMELEVISKEGYVLRYTHLLNDLFEKNSISIFNLLDLSTGKLREEFPHVTIELFLSPHYFLYNYLGKSTDIIKPEYVTYVILHEIGHILVEIENGWKVNHISKMTFDLKNNLQSYLTIENVKEQLESTIKALSSFDHKRAKAITEAMQSVLKTLEQKKRNVSDEDILNSAIFSMKMSVDFIYGEASNSWIEQLSRSDINHSALHFSRVERGADQFAARFMGPGITTEAEVILGKINETSSVYRDGKKDDTIGILSLLIIITRDYNYYHITSYDPILERMRQILDETKIILKDPDLPDEVRKFYLNDYNQGLVAYNEFKSQKYIIMRNRYFSVLEFIKKYSLCGFSVFFNRVLEQNKLLQDTTQDYIRNPFSIHQARLKELQSVDE